MIKEVRMNTEQLKDIEAISQLKARYFRFLDTKKWKLWADCFTSDISATYEGAPRGNDSQPLVNSVTGRDTLVDLCATMMVDAVSVHQGYMPEILLTSETTATGIWSMRDIVRMPTAHFKGWGHYHDEYVKEDGKWKIKTLLLTRLHTEEIWL
jgi:SnoaL-like domain